MQRCAQRLARSRACYIAPMERKQAIQLFAVSAFVGLLAGVGTLNLATGLAGFVICFLGWGGWQLLTERPSLPKRRRPF